MSSKQGKRYTSRFKFQIALEAMKGEKNSARSLGRTACIRSLSTARASQALTRGVKLTKFSINGKEDTR